MLRIIIPASILLLITAIALPILWLSSSANNVALVAAEQAEFPPAAPQAAFASPPRLDKPDTPAATTPTESSTADAEFRLRVLRGDAVYEMSMADFLIGVVAAEMPVSFAPQALQAQAVAARTFTLYRKQNAGPNRHPEADICGNYACCKAYASYDTLRERWGNDFDTHRATITRAVLETDGVILLYNNSPILAAFHAASSGFTEAAESIWNPRPYLQSVRSFESPWDVPRYEYSRILPLEEFRAAILAAHPTANLPPDNAANWITNQTYTESGRLSALDIGGVTLAGIELRSLLNLRSTAVDFTFSEDAVTITTRGHGHGIGMSQYGANTLAGLGFDYRAILAWYYTDITFGHLIGFANI